MDTRPQNALVLSINPYPCVVKAIKLYLGMLQSIKLSVPTQSIRLKVPLVWSIKL